MPSRKIIFDSPVKTPLELKEAIDLDFHMNLDNEKEVFFFKLPISILLSDHVLSDWSS